MFSWSWETTRAALFLARGPDEGMTTTAVFMMVAAANPYSAT